MVSTFKLIQDKQSWISHRLDTRLKLVQQCLAGGDKNSSGALRSCDLDFAFSLNPTPGLESDVLNAMRLSLAE